MSHSFKTELENANLSNSKKLIVGAQYSRSDIYKILKVPSDKQGADWNNGYHREGSDYYIFCNVDTAGRTGHEYPNYWNGEILVWSGKTKSHFKQDSIKKLLSDAYRKLIFYRTANRMPFTFAGIGTPKPHFDTNKPVRIDWSFPATNQKPQIKDHSSSIRKIKTSVTNILKEIQQNNEEFVMGIHEAVELSLGLLSGQRHLEAFDRLSMQDVTDDEELCRIYEESKIQSFSYFLALGNQRFLLPNYKQNSEHMLKNILRSFLRKITPKEQTENNKQADQSGINPLPMPEVTSIEEQRPEIAPPHSSEPAGNQQDVVTQLLNGSKQWELFDHKQMSDLTDDIALCAYYEKSLCNGLSEFLALSEKRLDIAGHCEGSEERLKEELIRFLKFNPLKNDSHPNATDKLNKPGIITKENEEQIQQEHRHQYLITQLMHGNTHWDGFDGMSMSDLTHNTKLRRLYNRVNAVNLSEFLSLGRERMTYRGYGRDTELKLTEELHRFLNKNQITPTSIASRTEPEDSPTNLIQADQPRKQNEDENPKVGPKLKTESLHIPTDSVKPLAKELLAGSIHVEAFDHLWIGELSSDVRLANVYENSQCSNISEFLALGEQRMKIKNYGKRSERKLKEGVERYLSKHGHETSVFTQSSIEDININHDSLVIALKKGSNAGKVVGAKLWWSVCKNLKASKLSNQKIASISAELQMKWPISQKSALSNKRILDYLGYSITDLINLDRFGHKKVKVYVACVIYLHKLHTEDGMTEPCSLEETISILWESSQLTDQEQKVLHLRFGIQEERKHTLTEIKEHFGITRERVRQIEKKALIKLRMNRHFEDLPNLIVTNKVKIWKQLTKDSKLKKREWMEPLEDQLGFEHQIAIELIDYRKHRNTGSSALSSWLDQHFPHDESNWYQTRDDKRSSNELPEAINPSIEAFLDTL